MSPTPERRARRRPIRARRSELFHLRGPAFAAFAAAMQESPSGRLESLLRALEKDIGAVIVRGAWHGRTAAGRYAACPLSVLFASPAREVESTIRACAVALARHGWAPRDFYRAWDAGLIGRWELLRVVDRELTRRLGFEP